MQADDGVTVTIADIDTGKRRDLRTQFLVAAEGAHSPVREALGIPFEGRGVFSNSMTIYFTADLAPQLLGKPLSVIYISNPTMGGFFRVDKDCQAGFLVVNTIGDPATNPDVADAAKDTSEGRLIELVRAAAGVPDLAVRIDGVARWRASSDVAARYSDGRIFLVGDAAHVMPPNGGFGGNTGIHDAYDIAWKLAWVVEATPAPACSRPTTTSGGRSGRLTVEQAYTRYVTRTATYLGATDYQPLVPDLEIELGYVYGDPDVVHADPRATAGRPGTRAPHLWIQRDGRRVSTLDLFGRSFVVLAGPAGRAWLDAADGVGAVQGEVAGEGFTDAYGVGDVRRVAGEARRLRGVAVRRARSSDPAAALREALSIALRG